MERYFQCLKGGKVGLTSKPPRNASDRGVEIGRVSLSDPTGGGVTDFPDSVVLWLESDEESGGAIFSPEASELPRDGLLLEGLFAVGLRRCLPQIALGSASALLASDVFGFLSLATALLPLEVAMHPSYGYLVWCWMATKCGHRLRTGQVERVLHVVREVASGRTREHERRLLSESSPVRFEVPPSRISCAVAQPLLLRVLADGNSSGKTRYQKLVRTALRTRAWQDSLVALASSWLSRDTTGSSTPEERSLAERWAAGPTEWHSGMKPLHDGSQFYGPDLWEPFMLPEAVFAKIDGREVEFCREALTLAGHELPRDTSLEELARVWSDRWRDATPRTLCLLESEVETPARSFSEATELAFGLALPGLECLAHREWNAVSRAALGSKGATESVGEKRNVAGKNAPGDVEDRINGKKTRRSDDPMVAKFAKPRVGVQKTIWEFLRD